MAEADSSEARVIPDGIPTEDCKLNFGELKVKNIKIKGINKINGLYIFENFKDKNERAKNING